MFIQIAPLSKSFIATIYWTNERFFIGMNSEVIEQVVPFPEAFLAPRMITYQVLRPPNRRWVVMFKYSEIPCSWNLILSLQGGHVHILASLTCQVGVRWQVEQFSDF